MKFTFEWFQAVYFVSHTFIYERFAFNNDCQKNTLWLTIVRNDKDGHKPFHLNNDCQNLSLWTRVSRNMSFIRW